MRRTLAAVFAGLVVMILAAQLTVETRTFQGWVRAKVQPLVFELLNMSVTWDSVHFHPLLMEVELLGLKAYSGAATDTTPFLQTPRVTARFSLPALFQKIIEIDPIIVENPIVRFARDDKWINFLDIDRISDLASAPAGPPGSWRPVVRRLRLINADADFVLTPIDLRAHLEGLTVEGRFDHVNENRIPVRIIEGHGLYRMFGRDFQIGRIDGELTVDILKSPWVDLHVKGIHVRGAYPNAEILVQGSIFDVTNRHIFQMQASGRTETGFLNDVFFTKPALVGTAEFDVRYDGDFERFTVGGKVKSDSLLIDEVRIQNFSAGVSVSESAVTVRQANFSVFGGEIQAAGKLGLDTFAWELETKVDSMAPSQTKVLFPGAPKFTGNVSGQFSGTGQGFVPFNASGALDLSTPGLTLGITGKPPLHIPRGTLSSDFQISDGFLTIEKGHLATAREDVLVAGAIDLAELSTDLSLSVQSGDLSVLSWVTGFPISGWGTGEGSWQGTLSDPQLHFDFQLRDTVLPWFAADGAAGAIDVSRNEVFLSDVTAEIGGGSAWLASASVTGLTSQPYVTMDVRGVDVALGKALRPLLGTRIPIDGLFSGSFRLASPATSPTGYAEGHIREGLVWGEPLDNIDGRLNLENGVLRFNNIQGNRGAGKVSAWGSIDTLGPTEARVEARNVDFQDIASLKGYMLAGTGDASMLVRVPFGKPPQIISTAHAESVSWRGVPLGAVNGSLEMKDNFVTANIAASQITAAVRVALEPGYPGDLSVSVENLDLSPLITGKFPASTAFAVGGTFELHGPLAKLSATTGHVRVNRVSLRQERNELHNAETWDIAVRDGGFYLQHIQLAGDQTAGSISGRVGFDGLADLRVLGALEMQFFTIFIDELKAAHGRLEIDGTIRGPIARPRITAALSVTGGRMQLRSVNVYFEDVEAAGAFADGRIVLDTLKAKIGPGGMSGGGVIDMDGFKPVHLSLFATLTEAEGRVPQWLLVRVNGRIELVGPVDDLLMRGDLELVRALYEEHLDWEALILRLRPRRDITSLAKKRGFHVNMGLHSEGSIFIRNNLVDAKLRGDLQLTGYAPDFGVSGNLQILNGNLVFRENSFAIQNGQINFIDPERIRPFLDLTAKTRVEELQVGTAARRFDEITLKASGLPESLQIDLESSPPLEREDILSLLYFRRRRADTPAGGEAAAAEAVSLAFKLNEELAGFQSEVQEYFGFEQLVLEPAFTESSRSGTMKLKASKQLRKDLTAMLSTSLSSTDLDFRLGYSLTENWMMDLGWNSVPEDRVVDSASNLGNFSLRPRLHFEFQ